MNLINKRICFPVALNCSYGGNTIASLGRLADILVRDYCATVIWIFPKQPSREWISNIQKKYKVFFTSNSYDKCESELKTFFRDCTPDIIHTHYEAYDIAVAKAVDRRVSMVWHVHDYMSLSSGRGSFRILRKIYWHLFYFRHYGIYGRNVELIAVSAEMAAFCSHYKSGNLLSFPPVYSNNELSQLKTSHIKVLINGIEMNRVNVSESNTLNQSPFTFLSYGGQNVHKRIDYLVRAGVILYTKGLNFRIVITKGDTTENVVKEIVGNNIPSWLQLVEQTNDVNQLLNNASCYVSTSVHETMSTAIAEATLAGIPVIQSDIPGTYWNANNPSVFLFKSGNIDDLVTKMEMVIKSNRTQLIEDCRISRQNNLERLQIDTWCKKVLDSYLLL